MKRGLALSGGGIKSFSQLPVLKAFDEEGIRFDAISGTSMGSVIASFLAIGMPVDELIDTVLSLEEQVEELKIFNRSLLKVINALTDRHGSGVVNGEIFEKLLKESFDLYGVKYLKDVKIPLAIPSVDIITGKIIVFVSHPELFTSLDENWVVISEAKLATAVRASCSFPFVIDACPFEDYALTDGGVSMNLPLPLIEAYGVTQKVAVTMHGTKDFQDFHSSFALANRMTELGRIELDKLLLKQADLAINIPLDGVLVFEVGKGEYTMQVGSEVVDRMMTDIKCLKEKKSWLNKILNRKGI